jgi:hypothetical protein
MSKLLKPILYDFWRKIEYFLCLSIIKVRIGFRPNKEGNMKKKTVFLAILIVLLVSVASGTWAQSSKTHKVTINANVKSAAITIDGVKQRGTVPFSTQLKEGMHKIVLSAPGYEDYFIEMVIRGNMNFDAQMEKALYTLSVNASVRGAKVLINGKTVGSVPFRKEYAGANYKIQVEAAGYQPFNQTVNLNKDINITAQLVPVNFNLVVNSSVRGARVFINGSAKGSAPLNIALPPANYSIKVSADGYHDFTSQVTLTRDSTVTAQLQPIEYTLSVSSSVKGATVFLDNVRKSSAPYNITLKPGMYSVKVTAPGYIDYTSSVKLDKNTTVTATLQPAMAQVLFQFPDNLLNKDDRQAIQKLVYYVDGKAVQGPRFSVTPGRHVIKLVSGGFSVETVKVFEPGRAYTILPNFQMAIEESGR